MSSFLWLPIVFWRLCPGTACCFYFPCLFFFCPHYCLIWLTNALLPLWIFQQSLCQVISLSSCIFSHVSWVCFSYHLFGFPVLFPLGFLKIHFYFVFASLFLHFFFLANYLSASLITCAWLFKNSPLKEKQQYLLHGLSVTIFSWSKHTAPCSK